MSEFERAVAALVAGKLVVVPTETVYGLACDALHAEAVRAVFCAKGRPADNPLIVHVANVEQAKSVVSEWPEAAVKLSASFWPGPLTLVLPKAGRVPDLTTAGLSSVAVRCPSHPAMRSLIEAFGGPLAAPSANRFMAVSPTRVEDLDPLIVAAAEVVIDGGPCEFGIESTVVAIECESVSILRPGAVTKSQIESVTGLQVRAPSGTMAKASPGRYPKHYSPAAKVSIVESCAADQPGLVFHQPANGLQIKMPASSQAYAAALYASLHLLDRAGVPVIYIESPPSTEEWVAVWDRLRRMAD